MTKLVRFTVCLIKKIIMEAKPMPVLHRQDSHVATLTLNRPPANTMTLDAFEKLASLLDKLESDSHTRVLVLTGQGEKGFCAGFDLSAAANSGTVHQLA